MDPRSHEQHRGGPFGRQNSGGGRGGPRREGGGFGRRGGRGGFDIDFDAPMGRGPRRGRGDVRTAVLLLLLDRPMHGYEMIQQIRERSNDAWSPSPGAIYPTIQLLTDEDLITSSDAGGKKVSSLTEAGRTAAEALAASKSAPWDDASSDAGDRVNSLRQSVFQLMQATRQIGMAGTDAQRQRTTELLDETRKKIYAMLASDEI